MLLWLSFIVCTSAIVFSGTRLSKYGDIIAEKTGLGRAWIGLVLMASVTSLPELVTGISSVTFTEVPNIAIGDVLGSCVFNMLILALLDIFQRKVPISTKAHHGHVLSGSIGILLLGVVSISLLAGHLVPFFGWVGAYSLFFALMYLFAVRLTYQYEKRHIAEYVKEAVEESRYRDIPLRSAVQQYVLNALVVVLAALFLPSIGERIAEQTGLGQAFVGNIFIALSTSLPEVVVSVAAVRIGSIDLAISNLLGSNIFNIFILAIDDCFFLQGPLLSFANTNHIFSAISAIIMSTIAIIGITYRAQKKPLILAWDSLGIIFVYLINLMLLYLLR